MNHDIVSWENGLDLGLAATAVSKAKNVINVQQGSLEYAPDFGSDLRYFLTSPFQFQNASFKGYLVERLTRHQINVTDVLQDFESVYEKFTFFVDNENDTQTTGFIR